MKRCVGLAVLIGALVGALMGCGSTPVPTESPPTQTPWIIVITATPGAKSVAEAQPTQTPWIIVATPTRSKSAEPTPTDLATASSPETTDEPTATSVPPTPTQPPIPTNTPRPESIKYPPPVLVDPPPEAYVAWKGRVLLKWNPVGELAEDEYYRLELDRPPASEDMLPYGDYVFVKDTEYLLEGPFLAPFHPPEVQGQATVTWRVQVVRKTGEDDNGKPIGTDISLPSEKWTLILDPKPEDA